MENFKNEQFASFQLHTILRRVIDSQAALLLPSQDVDRAFVQRV